jgi:hypothetical protein
MVTDRKKNSRKTPGNQAPEKTLSEPNKIGASTPYDFNGKNLTPYGGLLPVITMLDKLGFQSLGCARPPGSGRRPGGNPSSNTTIPNRLCICKKLKVLADPSSSRTSRTTGESPPGRLLLPGGLGTRDVENLRSVIALATN